MNDRLNILSSQPLSSWLIVRMPVLRDQRAHRLRGGGSAADYIIDVLQRDFDGYFNNVAGDRYPFTSPAAGIWGPKVMTAAETSPAFTGEKTAWHGFDRYDFVMDEATLAITPFKAPPDEGDGVNSPAKGQRRCIVVAPKQMAAGNPWSWQGCYWNHMPQAEIELLKRGFCIAYISADATLKPGREWDAWYEFLTAKNGLSTKPAFIGMSRGGEYSYIWATTHPDKVSCVYADNTGGNQENLARLGELASHDVPLLHVNGSLDPILGKYSTAIENIYRHK